MRRAINTSTRLFSEVFNPTGPVIEIGSLYLPGYEDLSDLRPYFPGLEYIGCDIRKGLGVDRIENAHDLNFADNSVGTVLMLCTLEHLPRPCEVIAEANRVLRSDGFFVLAVPFTYRLHGFPTDYWRFTSSGVCELLTEFPNKVIYSLGPRLKPAFVFAVATKNASNRFEEKMVLFQARVEETFQESRLEGYISVLKERARDFFGHLLGRSEMGVEFFDPSNTGGYAESLIEKV